MNNFKRSLVIGCGGVGRSLAVLLNDYSKRGIEDFNTTFVFSDPDEVEEQNIWTQGFSKMDAMSCANKTVAMTKAMRNPLFQAKTERIERSAQLIGYDAIFIACDNLETRKFVYEHCLEYKSYFVDGRVNSTLILVQDSSVDPKDLMSSVEGAEDHSVPHSCLASFEKDQQIIHSTPFITAGLMIQMWLNHLRGIKNSPVELAL